MKCSVDGCLKPVRARGLCQTHYDYAFKKGLVGTWKFPAGPLRRQLRLARLDSESWLNFSDRIGVPRATVETSLRHSKIEWTTVDEICIALRLHPVLLYPDWEDVFDMDVYLQRRREAMVS